MLVMGGREMGGDLEELDLVYQVWNNIQLMSNL